MKRARATRALKDLPSRETARRLLAEARGGRRKLSPAAHRLLELIAEGGPPTRLKNAPARKVMIGDQVEKIWYRKGQAHECDRDCAAADHRFVHVMDKKFPLIWDLQTGKLEI